MIFGPEHLSIVSFIAAAVCAAIGALIIIQPGVMRRAFVAFPRNKSIGIVITAVSLLWSALLINQMTLGELSKYKDLLYVLTPLAFYLVIRYLEELLAARSLGGLMMLLPTILVDAARWHPSAWRLVVVTLGYVLVIFGIWLVLSPFKFRVWTGWIMGTAGRRNTAGALLLITAGLLAITGIVSR